MSTTENYLTLSQAAKHLPSTPHSSALWRWCRKGIRGVKLQYVRMGGRILTKPEWLDQFGRELAALDAIQDCSIPPSANSIKPLLPRHKRTQEQRDKASQKAVADLKARGL